MNSRYIPFTQQKYCCVPACFQMVMYKNGLPIVSQEDLGYAMGLTVPKQDVYLFSKVRTGKMPLAGWGTQIAQNEYSLDNVLKDYNIPLKMELHLISEFKTVSEMISYLVEQQDDNSDVFVCYDYGSLFDTDFHNGHVNVFDRIDLDTNSVWLIDPEQRVPKYRQVDIAKLYDSMVKHGDKKSGGFWQFVTA